MIIYVSFLGWPVNFFYTASPHLPETELVGDLGALELWPIFLASQKSWILHEGSRRARNVES